MKKVYKQRKWKKYSKKRSEIELKKRKRKKRRKRGTVDTSILKKVRKYKKVKIEKKYDRIKIYVPPIFSIQRNIEEMLIFFDTVSGFVRKEKKIFFDMSKIEEITADAILYMLSRLDYYEDQFTDIEISGNIPKIRNVISY